MAAWVSQRTGNWALVSGNAASPWHDGGAQTALNTVPGASGTDTVTITATHVVTYDYDMSAAGVLSALVINGTLTASTGTGNWYLKMGGTAGQDITFGAAGYLLAGSSGTALPVGAVFTIDLNGASKIDGNGGPSGCIALYCTSPTWVGVRIAGAEAIGQTSLEIDGYKRSSDGVVQTGQDLTTDTMWAATRGVRIEDVPAVTDTEARVIDSTASSAVVVTAGLTAAKTAGAWIWLTWRNVRIIGLTAATSAIYRGTGLAVDCEIACNGTAANTGQGVSTATGVTMNAGVIHGANAHYVSCTSLTIGGCAVICGGYGGNAHGLYSCHGATIQGNAVFSGISQGAAYACYNLTVQGSVLVTAMADAFISCIGLTLQGSAQLALLRYGLNLCAQFTMAGSASITTCTQGIRSSSGVLRGGTLNNTIDIISASDITSDIRGWGATLAGGTQNSGYRTYNQIGNAYTVIWDIGGVEGAVKAWTYGGVVASVATQPTNWPASPAFVQSYQHTFESVLGATFLDKPIYGKAGQLITIDIYCKMSATGMSTRGTFVLIDPDQPLPIPTVTLDSEVMANNTDWQKLTLTYTPTYDRELTLRGYGVNASGTLIWREVVTFGTGGGGSIFGGAIVR